MVSKVKKIAEAQSGEAVDMGPVTDITRAAMPLPKNCATCAAWVRDVRDNNVAAAFGGCARSGKTTSTYGEDRYVHYTTDTTSCSLWQPKED